MRRIGPSRAPPRPASPTEHPPPSTRSQSHRSKSGSFRRASRRRPAVLQARAASVLEHEPDGQKCHGGVLDWRQSATMAALIAFVLPERHATLHEVRLPATPALHVARCPSTQVASQETHASGHMVWIARPDLITRYGLPREVSWELAERLFSLPVLKSKRAPAGRPIAPALSPTPPPSPGIVRRRWPLASLLIASLRHRPSSSCDNPAPAQRRWRVPHKQQAQRVVCWGGRRAGRLCLRRARGG